MDEHSAPPPTVEISLTADEALVLYGWLSRFSDSAALTIVDLAEERALWNLHALLEKVLLPPIQADYIQQLERARNRLRDNLS